MQLRGARRALVRRLDDHCVGQRGKEARRARIKDGFVLREVAGQAVVIATGEASEGFHGMVKLNGTGKRIWQGLTEGRTDDDIARDLAQEYGVSPERAAADVREFVEQVREAGFLAS